MTLDAARRIPHAIAAEIGAGVPQVAAAIALLDGGATVPFVARYRKEATGGLDDTQLRTLAERLTYLREMEGRRAAIVASIPEQGKMTDDLARALEKAGTKAELEDIYLPYKPKRRTKAMIARENGLQPLHDAILADRRADPVELARGYVSEAVPDAKAALDGARDILAEGLAEDADLLGRLRGHMKQVARLNAQGGGGEGGRGREVLGLLRPFRGLGDGAVAPGARHAAGAERGGAGARPRRGRRRAAGGEPGGADVRRGAETSGSGPGDRWLREAARWAWRVKLGPRCRLDLMADDARAGRGGGDPRLRPQPPGLLLAAPAGRRSTMGLDPGIRTGCKVAVVDATGKVVATETVYPFQPRNDLRGAQATLARLIARHGVEAHRHRQRHREPRDREDGRRPARGAARKRRSR